jgi:hypothetical protein
LGGTVTELFSSPGQRKPPRFDVFSDANVAFCALLSGFKRGEEVEQRAALGRLLRSGELLSREFRDVLALLFERRANGRRLVFQAKRGRQIDPARALNIATHVQMIMNADPTLRKESAVAETMAFFNLKWRSQVYAALKKYEPKSPV